MIKIRNALDGGNPQKVEETRNIKQFLKCEKNKESSGILSNTQECGGMRNVIKFMQCKENNESS